MSINYQFLIRQPQTNIISILRTSKQTFHILQKVTFTPFKYMCRENNNLRRRRIPPTLHPLCKIDIPEFPLFCRSDFGLFLLPRCCS